MNCLSPLLPLSRFLLSAALCLVKPMEGGVDVPTLRQPAPPPPPRTFLPAAHQTARPIGLRLTKRLENEELEDDYLGTSCKRSDELDFSSLQLTEDHDRSVAARPYCQKLHLRDTRGLGNALHRFSPLRNSLAQLDLSLSNPEELSVALSTSEDCFPGTPSPRLDASDCETIKAMQGLESLDLSGRSLLSNIQLRALLGPSRPHLQTLNLSQCSCLTAEGFKALGACPNLKTLDLSFCTNLKDSDLEYLAIRLPNLQTLILSHCHQLTDQALEAIAACFRKLEKLHLSHCRKITWKGLVLLPGLPELRRLHLSQCPDLTSRPLLSVIKDLRDFSKLQWLEIRDCPGLRELAENARTWPGMTVIY